MAGSTVTVEDGRKAARPTLTERDTLTESPVPVTDSTSQSQNEAAVCADKRAQKRTGNTAAAKAATRKRRDIGITDKT